MSINRNDSINIKKSLLVKVVSFAIALCFIFSNYAGFVSFADSSQLTISMSVNNATPNIGEEVTYTIRYAYPSIVGSSYDNCVISDTLPANLIFTGFDVNDSNCVTSQSGSTISFSFATITPGTTGIVKFKAKVGPAGQYITNGSKTITTNSTISADGVSSVTSNDVTVTPKANAASNWSMTKSKTSPSCAPALDHNVTYQITVNSNSAVGGLDIKDVVVTDTIPTGATFVSASDSGTFDNVTGKITWNIASLALGGRKTFTVVLKYTSPTFKVGDSVVNSVIANGKQIDDTALSQISASATVTLAAPIYSVGGLTKGGRQGDDRYSTGQLAKFYIGSISNNGNVALDKYEIVDTIPTGPNGIELTQISTGSYSQSANVEILYKTNLHDSDWNNWTSVTSNTTLNVSGLGLESGDYVTQVKWVITPTSGQQFESGFTNTTALNVFGTVNASTGTSITNNAQLDVFVLDTDNITYINKNLTKNASFTIRVINPVPWVVAQKTTTNGSKFNPNATVNFNLRVSNNSLATGDYVNPVVYDKFDSIFEDVTFISSSSPSETEVNIDSATNELRANITKTLKPGEYVDILCSAKVKDKTTTGIYYNTMNVSTLDNTTVFENSVSGDSQNVYGFIDGKTRKWMSSRASIYVNFIGKLTSELKIKGQNDSDFGTHAFPDTTTTNPGGLVDYQLTINNSTSNGTIKNIILIDKLPLEGDTGVVDSSSRQTQWTPYLVNRITGVNGTALPADTKVYYTTKQNPSCIELEDPKAYMTDPNTADGWSETPPADITTVKAIKIVFVNMEFKTAADKITVEWPMRAPVGAPTGEIAWDSFGYSATYPDGIVNGDGDMESIDSPFLPTEPNKVGFKIEQPTASHTIGDRVWEDLNRNGIQDNGEPGINGVLVNLRDATTNNIIAYTRTGNNDSGDAGYYLFPQKPDGSYKIEFVYPKTITEDEYTSDLNLTTQKVGDAAKDSNHTTFAVDASDLGNGTQYYSVTTDTFTISGADDTSIDLGLYRFGQIGDLVWYDKNGNGIQDSGEDGISDVIVKLVGSSDPELSRMQITDENGNYLFTNLKPDTYTVEYLFSYGYAVSPKNIGSDGAKNSDPTATSDTQAKATVTLASGEINKDIDMGLYLGHIGDLVWEDTNLNGVRDNGEPGVGGVTVNLYKDGEFQTSVTTSSSTNASIKGTYSFDDLFPGNYSVEVVKPTGYKIISEHDISKFSTDKAQDNFNDINTNGQSDSFILNTGERINTIDAGLYKLCSIGDKVWNDYNQNGIQDSGELGISGVTVKLTDKDGNPVLTDGLGNAITDRVTNSSGIYSSFTNLEPGEYKVIFVNPGKADETKRYVLSPTKNTGSNDTNDSDGVISGGNYTADEISTGVISLLTSGASTLNVDQGMYRGHIGNLVWHDLNANGIKDTGESVLNAVTVKLYKDGGTTAYKTTTTNASGIYSFDDLPAGNYVVEVTKLSGYNKFSSFSVNGLDAADDNKNHAIAQDGKTSSISLTLGQITNSIDVGMYKYVTLGDKVWEDKNANGVQDSGELGIASVTVNLLDSSQNIIQTKTTDSNGAYSFTNLDPGTYYVSVVVPADYYISPKGIRTAGVTDANDSDIDNTGKTVSVTLASGGSNPNLDAGLFRAGSIGDFVWEDTNGNGVQDTLEPAINGVKVTLLGSDGTTRAKDINGVDVADTSTDSNGLYKFSNLKPGNYYVLFEKPNGFDGATLRNVGAVDKDSNIDRTTFKTAAVTIISYEYVDTIDAGFYKNAHIGDYVWSDTNADGVQDSGESGIPNVAVNLYNGATIVASTTTDASGYYHFDIIPGTYTVEFIRPSGYSNVSAYKQGGDVAKDSDIQAVVGTSGKTGLITVASNETNNTIDAGYYKTTSIGNFVWNDKNADGIQGGTEPGIKGVTVNLYDSSKTKIDSQATKDDGSYSFINLLPGTYYVGFDAIPSGFNTVSPKESGLDRTNDSNIDTATLMSAGVTLTSGQVDDTIDAGFYMTCSIGDKVWEDKNADGVQNAGEAGIQGVTVTLIDGSGNSTGETCLTGASGEYEFSGLIPGAYSVSFEKKSGYFASPKLGAGSTSATDSDIDTDTFKTAVITLLSGDINNDIDAGMFRKVTIGDFVWEDLNANNKQDSSEKGIADVNVTLYNGADAVISSMKTDKDGKYLFTDLIPGTYYVEFEKPNGFDNASQKKIGTDEAIDSNISVSAPFKTDNIVTVSGDDIRTIDAGFFKLASLGDLIWEDMNANGIQDNGEKGIENILVSLLDSNGDIYRQAATDSNGEYLFTGLIPGNYSVQIVKPLAFSNVSPRYVGTDTALDSNISLDTFTTDEISLSSGEVNRTLDGGLFKLASIGDYVWYDDNSNGIQDEPSSRGVNGVIVTLYNDSGNVVSTAITANDLGGKPGYYKFTGLTPSSYSLKFTNIPSGYNVSQKNATGDGSKDSDVDGSTFKTRSIVLVSGQSDDTWDMGIKYNPNADKTVGFDDLTQSTATLTTNGDKEKFKFFVGFDIPQGILNLEVVDNLDPAFEIASLADDIKVILGTTDVTAKFNIIYNKTTKAVDIKPIDISTLDQGRYFVTMRCGIASGINITSYPEGKIPNFALVTVNSTTLKTNVVYVKPEYAKIGGVVWIDTNKDGVVNPNSEKGINDVIVDLYTKDGTLIDTQTTKPNGNGDPGHYQFNNLNPGEYYLEFTDLPLAYFTTNPGMGVPDTSTGKLKYKTKIITIDDVQQTPLWDVGVANNTPNPRTLGEPNKYLFASIIIVMLSSLILISGHSVIKISRSKIRRWTKVR